MQKKAVQCSAMFARSVRDGLAAGIAQRLVDRIKGRLVTWPRPLHGRTRVELTRDVAKGIALAGMNVYQAKTGRVIVGGVVNRKLNRPGQAANLISMVMSAVATALALHELAARGVEQRTLVAMETATWGK